MWSNLPTVAFLVVKLAAVFEVPVNAAFLALVYLLQMHLALLLPSLQLQLPTLLMQPLSLV